MKTKKHIAKNLKILMAAKGYNRTELAFRSGVSYNFLRGIINGSANASIDILDKICETMNVDIVDLVKAPIFCSEEEE